VLACLFRKCARTTERKDRPPDKSRFARSRSSRTARSTRPSHAMASVGSAKALQGDREFSARQNAPAIAESNPPPWSTACRSTKCPNEFHNDSNSASNVSNAQRSTSCSRRMSTMSDIRAGMLATMLAANALTRTSTSCASGRPQRMMPRRSSRSRSTEEHRSCSPIAISPLPAEPRDALSPTASLSPPRSRSSYSPEPRRRSAQARADGREFRLRRRILAIRNPSASRSRIG